MIAALLATRGVRHVGLLDAAGQVLSSGGQSDLTDPQMTAVVFAARAVSLS